MFMSHLRCARRAAVPTALGEDLKGAPDVSGLDLSATIADCEELVCENRDVAHVRGRSFSNCFRGAIFHGVTFASPRPETPHI